MAAGLASALVLACGVSAAEPPPAGYYTDLRYNAESDDFTGLNLEIHLSPRPAVDYELCEGACHGAKRYPAQIDDGVIRFVVREHSVYEDGSPAPPHVYRVEARLVRTALGRRLVVTSPDDPHFRGSLKPRSPRRR